MAEMQVGAQVKVSLTVGAFGDDALLVEDREDARRLPLDELNYLTPIRVKVRVRGMAPSSFMADRSWGACILPGSAPL